MIENKYIYSLNCAKTDTPVYIGQTCNLKKRYNEHCYRFYNTSKCIWVKENKANGLKPTISILDEVDASEADFWESHYIFLFRSFGFKLFNIDYGPGLRSRDTRIAHGLKIKGIKRTEEHRKILSEKVMGDKNPMKNKDIVARVVSKLDYKEICRKAAITRIKNGTNQRARERMLTDANPGKKQMKPLYQIDNQGNIVKEWSCSAEVEKTLGYFKENVSRACRGIMKTYKGYTWKYKTETECQ